MIHRQQLLQDLQRLLPKIEQDILSYSEAQTELDEHLKQEYAKAQKAQRTAEHFVDWRAAQVTQASVAWILTCVFIRFLEDNTLLDEAMIAGPAGTRLQHAKDRLTVYFNDHPTHAEREYLLSQFEALESLPAMGELLDRRHNPLWKLPVSADGAKSIIDFFQRLKPETGEIVHDFTDPNWDTRFLGDLYQDLSESVRKRYALLQTPEFVESFILDYTLEKAKQTFGLPGLRLIDPTCGSGHFLLTTFERLFNDWIRREPTTNARALAQRALDSVYGVDINPYAIAIARFRLLIAAMRAADSNKIRNAPDFHFNLAVGDSLLHGRRHESQGQGIQMDALNDPIAHVFDVEDRGKLDKILGQQYHIVVGNPPYIVVRDKALNQAYRDKYSTCHMKYSLGVPFTERFFDLTLPPDGNHPAGFLGMITANSFMKREFGKKLIEGYLAKKDLTYVIDTSGAYIPGHGTPTVILFARNQTPKSSQIRAVLGIRGEPGTPENAAQGKVWSSIVGLIEKPDSENDFVSVVDQERELYTKHPWSIGGGGASELKQYLDDNSNQNLKSRVTSIGFLGITGEDDVFVRPKSTLQRSNLPYREFGEGDVVRDWKFMSEQGVIFPYVQKNNQLLTCGKTVEGALWPWKTNLQNRKMFGKHPIDYGMQWYELIYLAGDRLLSDWLISFAFVATHNHFVLDRGGKVFNRSAPVIKLPTDSTETHHLALLGLLNSSTACFWMKQIFHNKGSTVDSKGARQTTVEFENFYEHTGTGLKNFPVADDPDREAQRLAKKLDQLAQQLSKHVPATALKQAGSILNNLEVASTESATLTQKMIALQEELDWLNYRLYGLTEDDLCYQGTPPNIKLGERPFELHLARRMQAGEIETTWFQRHDSNPITEVPTHWPADYQDLTERRLQTIEQNPWIKLIEQPEYKRRWNQEPWGKRQQSSLREWLLDHLEKQTHAAELLTCAQLADRVRNDNTFQQVATLYTGTDTFDTQTLVSQLVDIDNVPQMAAARYKPKAMPKFRAWQETWDKQRAEDAIDARTELDHADPQYLSKEKAAILKAREIGDIPLPPQYATADFRKPSYWPLRGKLDVPKERFFSMPHSEKSGDNTLVIGWAGLNHLQRAQAIAVWYIDRKEQDGWDAEQLKPMLVALDELIPWLKQWHNEIDPEYGERLGDYYEGFLLEELRQLQISRDELLVWEPPATQRGAGRRRKTN
jgi:hypothetical protein